VPLGRIRPVGVIIIITLFHCYIIILIITITTFGIIFETSLPVVSTLVKQIVLQIIYYNMVLKLRFILNV
jgi:hypothetical protein